MTEQTDSAVTAAEPTETELLLAEERAKHALTLQAYDQQSADFAALRQREEEFRGALATTIGKLAVAEQQIAKKDAALREIISIAKHLRSSTPTFHEVHRIATGALAPAAQGETPPLYSIDVYQGPTATVPEIPVFRAAPAPSAGETVLRSQEATEDMIFAAKGLIDRWFLSGHSLAISEVWSAMLAAAPTTGETVLVPRGATDAMMEAAVTAARGKLPTHGGEMGRVQFRAAWNAALAAAPTTGETT